MRYSEIFNVSPRQLEKKGVFDADQSICTIPEFVGAYDEFIGYFANVFSIVPAVKKSERAFSGMVNRLQFREIANTCLGYSSNGTRGNGIGEKLAKKIAESIIEIYDLGVSRFSTVSEPMLAVCAASRMPSNSKNLRHGG